MFVVRCRYVANGGNPEGVGYLDKECRCTRDLYYAAKLDTEDEAWTHAAMSGELIPEDCWVEPEPDKERPK